MSDLVTAIRLRGIERSQMDDIVDLARRDLGTQMHEKMQL